jgi:HAD superfamily hydrolase (TIGR01490 family)
MNSLCLFDLDDTLLPIDSDHAWGEFVVRLGWVDEADFRRRNDAFYEQYKAGQLDINAYIAFATAPLQSRDAATLAAAHARFMQELVREHQARGDLVGLVTATNDFITAPIAAAFGIEHLIAVQLERDAGGTITGAIRGTPSYREGKVVRVGQWLQGLGFDWGDFASISAYSDSLNDLPLLERAHHPVATNPSPALEALARERQWRILRLFPQ